MSFSFPPPRIQPVSFPGFPSADAAVLRLDELHPTVSGNKWFKLKEYLRCAKAEGKTALLTRGGAYSNHLVAAAAAAQMAGMKSIGIVRGEEPSLPSHTLLAAKDYGMRLHFLSREEYRGKTVPQAVFENVDAAEIYEVPEGGCGALGMKGAKDILLQTDAEPFTHVVTAVGKGTTLAGLAAAAAPHQKIIGIPVLKNAFSLEAEIEALLKSEQNKNFELLWDYHFGGYAKHDGRLIGFMNDFYRHTGIPTDFVYTGKAFYAAFDLLRQAWLPPDSRLLLVHTGGLQGNGSLRKGTLIYT